VNARPPAPMTMNTVFVAMRLCIRSGAHGQSLPRAGLRRVGEDDAQSHHRAKSRWQLVGHVPMACDGNASATAERDGFPQMGHLISLGGLDLPNLEFHEQIYPVRYRRWELRADAAGPGMRRGGTGVRYEADVLVPCTWSFRAEGLDTPSGYGVEGGEPGPSVNNGFNQ